MRLAWVKAQRIPRHNRAAVVVVAVWGIVMLAMEFIARAFHINTTTCLLKRLTGLPCPACGGTRSFVCLLHGDILAAVAFNPLAAIICLLAAAALVVRMLLRRQVQVQLGPRERVAAMSIFVAAVLVNWAYLIQCGP
ncbi:MAG: DUF2752 domain-containing protein [Planctomycetaceae bacterium]|nr:DUF2752 domain-containing protein [Planctomycetaceae bacterium]